MHLWGEKQQQNNSFNCHFEHRNALINSSAECLVIKIICGEFVVQKSQETNSLLKCSRMSQKGIKLPELSSYSNHRHMSTRNCNSFWQDCSDGSKPRPMPETTQTAPILGRDVETWGCKCLPSIRHSEQRRAGSMHGGEEAAEFYALLIGPRYLNSWKLQMALAWSQNHKINGLKKWKGILWARPFPVPP